MPKRYSALLALSAGFGGAILVDLWPPLRGDYGWRWPYSLPEHLDQWLPSTFAILLYLLGAWWLTSQPRPHWQVMTWAYLGCAILPFIFLARWGDPLYHQFTRVADGGVSGPHRIAMQYGPDTITDRLRHWTDEQKRFAEEPVSIHAALAPPGLPLIYYWTGQFLESMPLIADPLGREFRTLQCHNLELAQNDNAEIAAASVGMLSPLWAGLAIFPLYSLGRRLLDSTRAQWAVLMWGLLPGLAIFTPVPNTVFPTLAMLCVFWLWLALEQDSYPYAFGAGLVMGLLTFLNISMVPLILFCGWLALGYHVFLRPTAPRTWSLQIGAVYALGIGVVWGAWMLYGGPNPYEILHASLAQHLELDRPYTPWLVLHFWDYGLFIGLPVFFFSIVALLRAINGWYTDQTLTPMELITLAFGISLLILNLSGTARGETGRVWQFFFPFSLLMAISLIGSLVQFRWLAGAQAAFGLVMILVIGAVGTGLTIPPTTPPTVESAQIIIPMDTQFGDTIRLTGVGGTLEDHQLQLDLRWQTIQWPEQPYYVAVIPVGPDGKAYRESVVVQPFEGEYPTSCWQPYQEVIQRVTIPLEGDPPTGDWWVSLSLHDYNTYDPLTVTLSDGTQDHQAGVGPIWVE